ncbi:Threonylcarbamoyladenosine tRNA methylthiotransferase MtaB [Sedimentisphaera cyanobacteriorum]|uniref:Threonylcarbamoyladenosine tRNA methylthiotransferase MtaB n=1 Tax=Sedimentisphaera cyanobacteriorum TaxID=1940790 RepID=A0A1Q2HP23_9BACT|nr:tRNA (N(6)-L-threonylcarbamoyladenosine(37)-C(2))-methylthiotransferase MtaB [Sedimentisphaera cyanobacteriorum]AQQ09209.1 Threonylcarbamoyladenosine tRNA methylthiotransferase MtaB [Sedimentisphaera cyanobacteriorum]
MVTFYITTLGCKVNQYESQQIRQFLRSKGLSQTFKPDNADIAVVRTCCITKNASSKSRQAIKRIHKANPECVIIANGCLIDSKTEEKPEELNNLIFQRKNYPLEQVLEQVYGKLKTDEKIFDIGLKNYGLQTRAFLKVQDGCDGFCSYCIIPKIRTEISSKPLDNILKESRELVNSGHKEIVLTGVFLGAYGKETVKRNRWNERVNREFLELVDSVAQTPGLERLRLSSVEPGDISEELMEIYKCRGNLAPHFHISLQSGSSRVLKLMNRQYSSETFRHKIDLIKSSLHKPAVTTDLIAGFPGETEADFEDSLAMCRYCGFSKMHVFSYSSRSGTGAANMKGHLPAGVIKQRAAKLSQTGDKLAEEFRDSLVGEEAGVIIEDQENQSGKCERYLDIKLTEGCFERGKLVRSEILPGGKEAKPLFE